MCNRFTNSLPIGEGRGGAKNKLMKKEFYTPPIVTVVEIGTSQILAGSFTGNAQDSDDSEFGGAPERRGQWGDLWQ